ncbi:MAG: YggU family protein [Acidobacteria bacterium]|nr:MAG: YggU family protein [Acidobacteriota bacterium]PYU46003.1 MAG: YggU family protein [Acidobacteriota bacterium]PYU59057.1 MAG: YggU family protein [Acidobacteriota bacterium]PYU59339.1 MAG: YggU family protein [Acidobacteriota bacterium]PYU71189.1 MAG: YggU family protein [Acidobacteriota bacterium]
MLEVQEREGKVIFSVRVQPRASKDEIAGEMGGALKVRLRAPAVEDRANEALVEFLAQLLKTPRSAVRILGGERSRTKRLEIRGVTQQQILLLVVQDA